LTTTKVNLIDEAVKIVKLADETSLVLRIMGAIAVRLHCPRSSYLFQSMERELSDIDLAGRSEQREKIANLLEKLGYSRRPITMSLATTGREIYVGHENTHLDIFLDKLDMCHLIRFRLEKDFPTIPLADLFLEKMQIVKPGDKDLKDILVLLREHQLGHNDDDTLNIKHIAEVLSKDWGFYYTVTQNLKKVKAFMLRVNFLDDKDRSDIISKIDLILSHLEKTPKSLGWRLRAKIGTSMKWYSDVFDLNHE